MAKKGGKGKGGKKKGSRDYEDCPREMDDPHMRGEGWGNVPDDQRGSGGGSHKYMDEEGY